MPKYKKALILTACIAFVIIAIMDINAFVDNARRGMLLFGSNVLPVLFPFFFISSILIELDLFKSKKSSSTSAIAGVTVMSYLSGYPTGARMLAQLYERKEVTRTGAIKTATFTSTASPIFIIATMGTAMFGSTQIGIIVFIAHISGALLNGVVYKNIKFKEPVQPAYHHQQSNTTAHTQITARQQDIVSKSLHSAIQNIMSVGGLIIIFFVASAPFGATVASVLEMTSGVHQISQLSLSPLAQVLVPCIAVSFGGLCVAMQGFVFLQKFQMPVWFYFTYKITHTIISAIICVLLVIIF